MNEEYYRSEEWKRIRELRKNYDGYKCRNCGSTVNLQVHHKNYSFQGREDVKGDLTTLCGACHEKITLMNRNKRRYRPYYGDK